MLNPSSLKFLKQLKKPSNNSKSWMEKHKAECDGMKTDVEAFADLFIREVSKFDPKIARAHLSAKRCLTRLNHDMRFHADGPLYKHDFYVVINPGGRKAASAFYYVHIEPGNSFAGGGVYNPQSRDLRKFRELVSGEYDRFRRLVSAKSFRSTFPSGITGAGAVKTSPRGFAKDDPAAEYLRLTGFCTKEKISDDDLTSAKSLKKILKLLRGSKPLVDFLNEAIKSR